MNLHFITYGDHRYTESKRLIRLEAERTRWFKSIEVHAPATLPPDRIAALSRFFQLKRGGGYWLWKPIIIDRKLAEIPKDDILIYADAGCVLNPGATPRLQQYVELLRSAESGCLAFQMGFQEEHYSRQDLFDYYQIPLESTVRRTGQLVATIQFYRKCPAAVAILQDVMRTVTECPELFTDNYDPAAQAPGFVATRHDQSIFSVVRKLHWATLLPDETYTENWTSATGIPIQARRRRKRLMQPVDQILRALGWRT